MQVGILPFLQTENLRRLLEAEHHAHTNIAGDRTLRGHAVSSPARAQRFLQDDLTKWSWRSGVPGAIS